MTIGPGILTLNGGSSSIKFALFSAGQPLVRVLSGEVQGIGSARPRLRTRTAVADGDTVEPVSAPDQATVNDLVLQSVTQHLDGLRLRAVGHRVVHGGGNFIGSTLLGPDTIAALRRLAALDPEHLPTELALVEAATRYFPGVPQIACFDTAFHHGMPRVAQLLPIPRRFEAMGARRYGFHGLSYAYLMGELARVGGAAAANGRVILAHLGSGASLSAVHGGKPVDTSMGFTPASGVPMATRSGDIDPGLPGYLARVEAMSPAQFDRMANFESGLLGISEISGDMRELLAREAGDVRAAEAVALFCYAVKKQIGGFAAALGGVETLVFSGGMGANAPVIRARICAGLGFFGIGIDAGYNNAAAAIISPDGSPVTVRVIATDEEIMIARDVQNLIGSEPPSV